MTDGFLSLGPLPERASAAQALCGWHLSNPIPDVFEIASRGGAAFSIVSAQRV